MYGDAEKASEEVKKKVAKDVVNQWSLLKGMTRERLYVSFASEAIKSLFVLRVLLFHSISEIKAQSSVLRINPTKCDLKTEVVEL